jgi:hypothetical protein
MVNNPPLISTEQTITSHLIEHKKDHDICQWKSKSWLGDRHKHAGGVHPACPPPLKLEKNMIFWGKIVIIHTKYPKNFRASLRSAQFV